jgi:hypothetical protein
MHSTQHMQAAMTPAGCAPKGQQEKVISIAGCVVKTQKNKRKKYPEPAVRCATTTIDRLLIVAIAPRLQTRAVHAYSHLLTLHRPRAASVVLPARPLTTRTP